MNSMGDYLILDSTSSKEWNEYLQRLPATDQDVYFTPEYYGLFERLGKGLAKCFIFKKDGEVAIYPFLLNSVNELGYDLGEKYFDIQGVYGYNGILYSSQDLEFIKSFFETFESFCAVQNIIVEFLRIGHFWDSKLTDRENFSIVFNQKNVIVDLLDNNIWKNSYEYSTRKNINKALRHNLELYTVSGKDISNEYLEAFKSLYYKTMLRTNAEEYYFFNNLFFANLAHNLGTKAVFYFVSYEKKLISCELVLTNGRNSYSYLGGTDSDYFHLRPADYLKHCIINDLKTNNGINFCLGGGTEGIFRFKKSFCTNGVIDFNIGKKIHNPRIYDEVVTQWERRNPEKVDHYKNIVLKYRY
jgi:hypothetical protein